MKFLYVVEDENYRLLIRAEGWQDAERKAINWAKNKISLDIAHLKTSLCDNDEVIE